MRHVQCGYSSIHRWFKEAHEERELEHILAFSDALLAPPLPRRSPFMEDSRREMRSVLLLAAGANAALSCFYAAPVRWCLAWPQNERQAAQAGVAVLAAASFPVLVSLLSLFLGDLRVLLASMAPLALAFALTSF